MSKQTSGEDWVHTLPAFRACLPRRGRVASDDRQFLEALHCLTVENARRRALPKGYSQWNITWKRASWLSKADVFEAFFDALAAMSPKAHLIQMFDSTIMRANVSAAGAKGRRRARRSAVQRMVLPSKTTQNPKVPES